MTKPVLLSNGSQWATQTLAKQHFKNMLHRYSIGSDVSDPQDHSDLSSLLEAYDSVVASGGATKIGSGIANFSKQRNVGETFSTPGFHVHHTDGTSIDFSYQRAVEVASKLNSGGNF
jgi:hypothetical protein